MRLIDADHLKKWIINRSLQYPLKTIDILDQIDRELTYKVMIDIVRCKDCKHKYIEEKVWNCPFGLPGGEEFFCSYGERMDGDGE